MNRFPLSIDLTGKRVFLVGNGPQIRQKAEKLAPFGAELVFCEDFTNAEAEQEPAMVVVGDTAFEKAKQIFRLCSLHRIPVNVVDVPELCSFHFPALILRQDLTISISTGGRTPAAASYLRQKIEEMLPDATDEIFQWLGEHRAQLREKQIWKAAVAAAFSANRPLTQAELAELEAQKP